MIVSTQAVPRPGFPWRPIAIVALLAMLLAASIGGFLAMQSRPAPWFGPAGNGRIAFDQDGAIKAVDPSTGEVRIIKADATGWVDPWYSPDGRTLLLARETGPAQTEFAVMPADGGDIRVITPEPLREPGAINFSPDGRSLIFDTPVRVEASPGVFELRRTVVILDIASGDQRVLDLGDTVYDASPIPPDGATLLASAGTADRGDQRVVIIDLASETMTSIVEPEPGRIFVGHARVSPDGRWVAYADWSDEARHGQLHVRSIDATGSGRAMADVPGVDWTTWPGWSPDGRSLSVQMMQIVDGRDVPHLGVIDVASGQGRQIDLDLADGMANEWSPESDALLVSPVAGTEAQTQLLVDPTTLEVTTPAWATASYPSWQRLAP